VEGEYFDTAHFTHCLLQYPFQGGGCYLLLDTVEVDYHFPIVTIHKILYLTHDIQIVKKGNLMLTGRYGKMLV
jgi:hypothetical protein